LATRFVRPDFSDYVVHFTKDTAPLSAAKDPDALVKAITPLTAPDRLFKILQDGVLRATRMPWTNKPAVAFTECTWASLLDHANRYSRFGVGFHKAFLFACGGGPAIYLTPGLLEHQKTHVGQHNHPFDDVLYAFVTPFCPHYAPKKYKDQFWKKAKTVDYTHEREWRVPHDLVFKPQDVAFVIVADYEHMAKAPKALKDTIGRKKWLLMDNYERVERIWPVHRIP
jgi:hypothetical protein